MVSRRYKKEIIAIYDALIQQSSKSIGKPINIGYRN